MPVPTYDASVHAMSSISSLLKFIGDDPDREGLRETPRRVLDAWRELLIGYHLKVEDAIKLFDSDADEMVVVKDIDFMSFCEHHCLPFTGKVHVGYLPQGKVIGLSKIPRIVDIFAKRLQIQENMTCQIAEAIGTAVRTDNTKEPHVGVVVEASHFCVGCRGVRKTNTVMVTSKLLGFFKTDEKTRSEFLNLVRG